jgi:PAS domain S-box-containing protein
MNQQELRANILIVNDRPDQLVALSTVLTPLQENLVMARSGEEALRQLLHHEFAVVLLDVHMPSLDGFETASLIRQRGRSRSTPIIFITAYGQSDEQVSRSYSLGAVDYIQTPIVPDILRSKVNVFVQLYKKSEELRLMTEAEHQRQLNAAKEKLEAETKRNLFFVLSIDLLAVAGFDGYLKQINPAWEKVLGFKEEELKGAAFTTFAHPQDRAATIQQLETLKQGTAITYFEHRFACRDGQYKWLGWTASPFAADQLIYIFARDITERRLAEEKIHRLNRRLKARVAEVSAVNRELEAFTYSISHDLRAPLRSMQGFAQVVLADYGSLLPEPGRDCMGRIVESAAYMDQLLHDLLEYSRLNQAEFECSSVCLDSVLKEVLESLHSAIQEKEAQVDIQEPLLGVKAHLPTLKQVLTNLFANALKFVAPETRPHVRFWTEPIESDSHSGPNGHVRLWIEDNGIGIEADQHEKIFGLFQRVYSTETYPGTGIGLAIVRKGAHRMGGQVGVESRAGDGSRFWLELPAGAQTHHQGLAAA